MANEPRFAAVPPARIVPMLADEGLYLGSESSMAPACCASMGKTPAEDAPRHPRLRAHPPPTSLRRLLRFGAGT